MKIKQTPYLIAWHDGLTIILFEEVQAVDESYSSTGAINVFLRNRKESIRIEAHRAKSFLDRYLAFLMYCEDRDEQA